MTDERADYRMTQVSEAVLNNIASNPQAIEDIYRSVLYHESQTTLPPQWEIEGDRIVIHHYLDATKMRRAILDARSKGQSIDTIEFAPDVRQVTADCFALVDGDCGYEVGDDGKLRGEGPVHITRFVDRSDFLDQDGEKRSFSITGSREEGILSHLHDLRQVCFFGHSVCEQHVGSRSIPLLGDESYVEQIVLGVNGGNPYIPPRSFLTRSRGVGALVNLNMNQVTNFGKEAFAYTTDLEGYRKGLELLEQKPPLKYSSLDSFLSSLSESEVKYIKAHPHYGLQWVERARSRARQMLKEEIRTLEKKQAQHIPCRRNRCDDADLLRRAAGDRQRCLEDLKTQCEDAEKLLLDNKARVDDQTMLFENELRNVEDTLIPEAEKAFDEARKANSGASRATVAELNDAVKALYGRKSDLEKAVEAGKAFSEGLGTRIEANSRLKGTYNARITDLKERTQADFPHMIPSMKAASDEGRLYLGIDNMELSNIEDRALLNCALKTDPTLDTNRSYKATQLLADMRQIAQRLAGIAGTILSLEGIDDPTPKGLASAEGYLFNDTDFDDVSDLLMGHLAEIPESLVKKNLKEFERFGAEPCTGKRSLSKHIMKLFSDLGSCTHALDAIGEKVSSPERENMIAMMKEHFTPSDESAKDLYESDLVEKGIINRDFIRLASRVLADLPDEKKQFDSWLSAYLSERDRSNVISRGMNTRTGVQGMFNTSIDAILDSPADRRAREVGELSARLEEVRKHTENMKERFPDWVSTKDHADLTEEGRRLKSEIDRIESAPVGRAAGEEAYAMNDSLALAPAMPDAGEGAFSYCGNKERPLGTYDMNAPAGEKGCFDASLFEGKNTKKTYANSFVDKLKFTSMKAMAWIATNDIFNALDIRQVSLSRSFANVAKLTALTLLTACDLVGMGIYGMKNRRENERMAEELAREMVKDYLSGSDTSQNIRVESGKTLLLDGKYTHIAQSVADEAMMQLTRRAQDFDIWRQKYTSLMETGEDPELAKIMAIHARFSDQSQEKKNRPEPGGPDQEMAEEAAAPVREVSETPSAEASQIPEATQEEAVENKASQQKQEDAPAPVQEEAVPQQSGKVQEAQPEAKAVQPQESAPQSEVRAEEPKMQQPPASQGNDGKRTAEDKVAQVNEEPEAPESTAEPEAQDPENTGEAEAGTPGSAPAEIGPRMFDAIEQAKKEAGGTSDGPSAADIANAISADTGGKGNTHAEGNADEGMDGGRSL